MLSEWAQLQSYKRQQALMDIVERPLKRQIWAEKNRFIRAVAATYPQILRIDDDLFLEHKKNMTEILRSAELRVMKLMHDEVVTHASSPQSVSARAESMIEFFFRDWFFRFGAARAIETAETTRQDIQNALLESQGGDPDAGEIPVIRRLLRARGLSAFRAATIARTETHNAAMSAAVRTAENIGTETGLTIYKQWLPVQDGRTRDSHAAMSGSKPIPMGDQFLVNGERLDRPGQGSPANAINCRCVLVFEPQ